VNVFKGFSAERWLAAIAARVYVVTAVACVGAPLWQALEGFTCLVEDSDDCGNKHETLCKRVR